MTIGNKKAPECSGAQKIENKGYIRNLNNLNIHHWKQSLFDKNRMNLSGITDEIHTILNCLFQARTDLGSARAGCIYFFNPTALHLFLSRSYTNKSSSFWIWQVYRCLHYPYRHK